MRGVGVWRERERDRERGDRGMFDRMHMDRHQEAESGLTSSTVSRAVTQQAGQPIRAQHGLMALHWSPLSSIIKPPPAVTTFRSHSTIHKQPEYYTHTHTPTHTGKHILIHRYMNMLKHSETH